MKILTQDRETITEEGKELWITKWGPGNDYMVMHNGYIRHPLGLYHTKRRAMEVLTYIFSSIDGGKATFSMPEK